jgi:hypothetical protein
LAAWGAVSVRLKSGRIDSIREKFGRNAGQFWTWLDDVTRSGSKPVLLAYDAYACVTALEFWEALQHGWFRLTAGDVLCTPAPANGEKSKGRGVVICDGKQCIIVARRPERNYTVRILSLRNYGVEQLGELLRCGMVYPSANPDLDLAQLGPAAQCSFVSQAIATWVESYARFLRENNLGGMQNTAASQAMHSYRRRFMRHEIEVHACDTALAMEREALYGGRCEAFYLGEVKQATLATATRVASVPTCKVWHRWGPAWILDVNSQYAAVAGASEMPTKLLGIVHAPAVEWWKRAVDTFPTVTRCRVSTMTPCVPVRQDGLVIYPVGTFETTLCGPEVKNLVLERATVVPITCAVYRGARIFSRWVDELFPLRRQYADLGNVAWELMLKRIIVSLFGKFSQRARVWQWQPDEATELPYDFWHRRYPGTNETLSYRCVADQVERLEDDGEHPESFPAITAYVYSLGRFYLWRLMKIAGAENVYYCDTDGLIVSQDGKDALQAAGLLHETNLGCLKVVGQCESVTINGIKHYLSDEKTVRAGTPSNAVQGESGELTWDEHEPFLTALEDHRAPVPKWLRRCYRNRTAYQHGKVSHDGLVSPFRLEQS